MSNFPKYEDTLPLDHGLPKYEETSPHPDDEDIVSKPESLMRGAGQGLTSGFMDEAGAGLQAGLDVGLNYLPKSVADSLGAQQSGKKISDLQNLYHTYKQLQQEREDQAQKQNPKTYGAGEIAGAIASPVNKIAGPIALGGLYGLGKSKADLTEIPKDVMQGEFGHAAREAGEAAKDTGIGMGLGVGGQLAGKAIGAGSEAIGLTPLIKRTSKGLQTEARDTALNVLEPKSSIVKTERGGSASSDVEYRKGMGKETLENIGFGGPEKLRSKMQDKISALEEQKKPLLDQADSKLQQSLEGTSEDVSQVAENSLSEQLSAVKDKVLGRQKRLGIDNSGDEEKMQNIVDAVSSNDDNILKLNDIKKDLDTELGGAAFQKLKTDLPDQAEFLMNARTLVRKRIEDLADKVDPGLGQRIKALNAEQSNAIGVQNAAFETEVKPSSHMGYGDYMAAAAGGGLGALLTPFAPGVGAAFGAAGGLTAKKGAERLAGWNLGQLGKLGFAKLEQGGANKLANLAEGVESGTIPRNIARPIEENKAEQALKPLKLSNDLYNASDDDLSGLASKLEQDPKYATYGKSLRESIANKSHGKKNAVLFTMLQNPNIRQYINGNEE